jgi:hypothetical protein
MTCPQKSSARILRLQQGFAASEMGAGSVGGSNLAAVPA